jgi:hypothetical protein
VQAKGLNQRPDLRLGALEQDRLPVSAQAPRHHGEIEHQRRIREHQVAQVDDDVRLGPNGTGQRLPSEPLRVPVFVATAAKRGRLVIEVDDARNLPKPAAL